MNYSTRLLIPIDGNRAVKLYTRSGMLIATGYTRVVIGKRGPYIEFSDDQILKENIQVPEKEKYRLDVDYVYYHEYRTKQDFVKLYFQRKTVDYADYRVGFWYISPFALKTDDYDVLIKPLKEQTDLFNE